MVMTELLISEMAKSVRFQTAHTLPHRSTGPRKRSHLRKRARARLPACIHVPRCALLRCWLAPFRRACFAADHGLVCLQVPPGRRWRARDRRRLHATIQARVDGRGPRGETRPQAARRPRLGRDTEVSPTGPSDSSTQTNKQAGTASRTAGVMIRAGSGS